MLALAAQFLERHRIPRSVAGGSDRERGRRRRRLYRRVDLFPLMEWSTRLPELASLLKDKLHVFDRPLALWQQLQIMVGGSDTITSFQMPKLDWIQPTIEFLSPTFTEFLLFFVTLILFIASWRDLRRALILTFPDHASRLRTLKILNEIEEHLGGYLILP
jgi:predicted PurR-regulated permease PerM